MTSGALVIRHEKLHPTGWRWRTIGRACAVAAGLSVGAVLVAPVAYLVLYLRRKPREAVGLDAFLTLGSSRFLFLLVPPVAVLRGICISTMERCLIGWFGIRGAGLVYYLADVLRYSVQQHYAATTTGVCVMPASCAAKIIFEPVLRFRHS